MKTLTAVALLSFAAMLSIPSARADWPSLFSKGSGSAGNANDAFWSAERPSFGSPVRPKIEAPAPRKTPVIFQKVNAGGRKVYDTTLGRVIPRAKPVPISATGRNTPWTRNKPVEKENSGSWLWPKKDTGPARSTEEFFKLKRPG